MEKVRKLLKQTKSSLGKFGFIGIETVVIGAVVTGAALFMGFSLREAGNDSRDVSLDVMSDNTSYNGENQIATLVEQILFYRKDNISTADPKFDNQTKLTAVQIPVDGHIDILAGVFPTVATNRKLKYTVTINPDVISVSDYGLTSATGYPSFRIQAKSGKAGYSQIKACASDGSHICSTLNVTVGTPASGISVDKSSVIVNVDKAASLKVAPIPEDATTQLITWEDTNGKLKDIVYNEAADKLTIVGKEAGTTTLILYLTDDPFGGTVYKKEIEVLVRDGINGVVIHVENPIDEANINVSWALRRGFTVSATNTTNIRIEKYQYYISDTKFTALENLNDSYPWKDYTNGTDIKETGTYIYFRACQAEEDVQDYNGESLCGKAFRFVLAVDTTPPSDSTVDALRKNSSGVIATSESELSSLGIAKQNGKGEYITTKWDKSILYRINTKSDRHSGFEYIEYQIGNGKENDNGDGSVTAINDENAIWGVYENSKFVEGRWATYNDQTELNNSGWRIRFRVCDRLRNCKSLGSRPYLIDNDSPISFNVEGVNTDNSTSWTVSKTITLSDGIDKHSGVKYYNYCLKDAISDSCNWNKFNYNGKSFGFQGKYIMFQAVDDLGNVYSDGTNYVLHIENSAPAILEVSGESSENAWATQRNFSLVSSKPLSNGVTYYYQISDEKNNNYGSFIKAGEVNSFIVKTSGKYIKFKVCLSNVTSICSEVTQPYNLFVDVTSPKINSINGASTTYAKSRVFTFGITEAHSGINRIEYASNTSFTDKHVCPDEDKSKCTIKDISIKTAYFRVYDNIGNVSTVSGQYNSYVDNKAPSQTAIEGGSTSWAKSRAITFKTVTDDLSGVNYLYCASSSESDCLPYADNKTRYDNLGNTNTVTINSGTAKYIYATTCDGVGNCSSEVKSDLYVDNTAPKVDTITGSSTTWATSRTFTVNFVDTDSYKSSTPNAVSHTGAQSGIVKYEYKVTYEDGSTSSWKSFTRNSNNQVTIKEQLGKTIVFRATDGALNTKTSSAQNLYTQTSFTIGASGSTSWSNASSRTLTLSSSCKGTTTYSFTDDSGNDSGTDTTRYWNVNSNNYKQTGTITGTCLGLTTTTSANIYIDRKPPTFANAWWNNYTGWVVANGSNYNTVGATCSDVGSGCQTTTYTSNAIYQINTNATITLKDNAGNTATQSWTYPYFEGVFYNSSLDCVNTLASSGRRSSCTVNYWYNNGNGAGGAVMKHAVYQGYHMSTWSGLGDGWTTNVGSNYGYSYGGKWHYVNFQANALSIGLSCASGYCNGESAKNIYMIACSSSGIGNCAGEVGPFMLY